MDSHKTGASPAPASTGSDTKDEGTMEVRCLIENNQVGGIIGKAGSNVKRVREESGAFVSILKADFRSVQERIMVIKGNSAQIAKATQLITELTVRDKKESSDAAASDAATAPSVSIRYLVHRLAVGAIIGKAGAVIKETQIATGARVNVSNEPLPQSTEKTVTITGTPSAVHQAAIRILVQLRDNPVRSGAKVYPYAPGQPVFQTPYGMPSPYGHHVPRHVAPVYAHQQAPYLPASTSSSSATASAQHSTQKIAIPTICAGSVIGRAGSVIRDLRAQSGASISIADPESTAPQERVVTLTGTPQAIQQAVYLIRQLVEQYQPAAAPGGF